MTEIERLTQALAAEQAKVARARALLSAPAVPLREPGTDNFLGFAGSTGEHRTVGPHRAWCHDDREWCYPSAPCPSCVPLIYPEDLRAALG